MVEHPHGVKAQLFGATRGGDEVSGWRESAGVGEMQTKAHSASERERGAGVGVPATARSPRWRGPTDSGEVLGGERGWFRFEWCGERVVPAVPETPIGDDRDDLHDL